MLNNLRHRKGVAIAAVIAVVLLAIGVFAVVLAQSAASRDRQAQQELLSQVQVVITPELTATPEALPTAELIVTPETSPTPELTPTLQPEPTPVIAHIPMPVRQCAACVNILLLGIDQRPKEDPNTARTDTMIILSLNTETHTAGMLSLPRDLYVPMPNTNTVDRINSAMAYGGPDYAMRAIEYNTGVPIEHYVRINFNVVMALVDQVGGIDVEVDQDINDPTYPDMNYGFDPFVISKGMHHMDGATALKYARTRHQTSDFYRIRRQQQIIMALRNRVLSTNAIPALLQNAPAILNSLNNSIATDMNATDMVQMLLAAKDIPTDKINRVAVDESAAQAYTTSGGAQVLLPNRDRIRQLSAKLLNQPVESERIALQNGTSTQGLAQTTQTYLQNLGYNIVQVGDAQNPYDKSVVLDYLGSYSATLQLATALGLPSSAISTTANANSTVDVQVILGSDYKPQQ